MIGPNDRIVTGVEGDFEETRLAPKHQRPVVRVFIGGRHYILAAGQQAHAVSNAWKGSVMGHLVLAVPPGTPVYTSSRSGGDL